MRPSLLPFRQPREGFPLKGYHAFMDLKKILRFSQRSQRAVRDEEGTIEEHQDVPQQLPLQNMFYGLGFTILFFWILKLFKFLFIAMTLSVFSCFMLLPIIHFFVRHSKMNRTFVSAFISLIYTLILVFASVIIFNNVLYFFSNISIYEKQMNNIINDIITKNNTIIKGLNNDIFPGKISITHPEFNIRDYILKSISIDFYLNSANLLFSFISGAILVFVLVFFMLNEAEKISLKLKHLLKDQLQKTISVNISIISSKISRYLQIKMIISFLTSLLVWFLLSYYEVENTLTWAFFTFAFNFIPNIGSIAITVLITLMSIIQFYPDWNIPLIIGSVTTVIQILVGSIFDPKLQGHQLDLSPLLILVSLAFWGYIWGVIGMFLAVPLLEILRITCNNIEGLQPIAVFIGSGKKLGHNPASRNSRSGRNPEPSSELPSE